MLYYNTIASFNNQKSAEKLRKILKIFRFFYFVFPVIFLQRLRQKKRGCEKMRNYFFTASFFVVSLVGTSNKG